MDHVTFESDMVLSDVHMHLPSAGSLMPGLDSAGEFHGPASFLLSTLPVCSRRQQLMFGQSVGRTPLTLSFDLLRPRRDPKGDSGRDPVCPVILKQSDPKLEQEQQNTEEAELRRCSAHVLLFYQVWRGALFLADFILSRPDVFRGATVLELGSGTGLTSIVMATTARTVYCTGMAQRMTELEVPHVERGEVRVRQLDWLQHGFCTEAEGEFSWSEEDVADLYDNTCFIIAADVCYDDHLTEGLFRTLFHLCSHMSHPCTIFISIEKRLNFSLRHMDVCCEAYRHFLRCLQRLQQTDDRRCCFTFEKLTSNFAQLLLYERVEQLVRKSHPTFETLY
uniref:Methyltransferase 22, Kin17 lysine n=1 Tax=Oryzias latipes TaxID=8090 RepID=A0A3B3IIH2_ORYLA